jgi:Cu(I)/Ag(I) efflux system membrane fusion protein
MKKQIILLALKAIVIFIASCSSQPQTGSNKAGTVTAETEVYYTCPMHPEVKSDKPGKCPKCGMELIKKEKDLSSDTSNTVLNADTLQMK